jgi:hypothetical protein
LNGWATLSITAAHRHNGLVFDHVTCNAPDNQSLGGMVQTILLAAEGTDPDDFIHPGHVNDLLARYEMTSDHVVHKAKTLLERRKDRRP